MNGPACIYCERDGQVLVPCCDSHVSDLVCAEEVASWAWHRSRATRGLTDGGATPTVELPPKREPECSP